MIEVRLQSRAPKVGVGVGELLEVLDTVPRQLPPQAQGVQDPRK
jgi:hypothetical protein